MTCLPRAIVHLDNILHNWRTLDALNPASNTAAVVKADAYGLGADIVSRALCRAGCDTFFVAYLEEGVSLRRTLGTQPRIFVLNGPQSGEIDAYIANGLTAVLSSMGHVDLWRDAPHGSCALHLETGMNRLGLQATEFASHLTALQQMQPVLVMSHLACADIPDHPLTARQKSAFDALIGNLPVTPASLANSAGCFLGPDYAYDLRRPGLALYGGGFPPAELGLKHAVTLEADVASVFDARKGESVGYGATATLSKDTRLATVNLGYADGFPRGGGNAFVAYHDAIPCPVVGRISMDLITIDVSKAHSTIKAGERVEFLGINAKLEEQAARAGTLGYELLTGLSKRVQRIYA